MSKKRKRIKKKEEDEELLEKLDSQNKALQKILKVLRSNNDTKKSISGK